MNQQPKRPTVAIDLDGVLATYNGTWRGVDFIGDPIPGAVDFTKEVSKMADVVIWTTRTNPDENYEDTSSELRQKVVNWLMQHGFSYRAVYMGSGKPIAAAYVDDRAVPCQPEKNWPASAFSEAIIHIRALLPLPHHE